jgi:phosphohistidine phosphatase
MKLYILRHAIAVERGSSNYPNDDRPLTEEGIRKMKKASKGLRRVVERPQVILTSPMKRAYETAEIAACALKSVRRLAVVTELLPGAKPKEIARLLFKHKDCTSLLIVGHEPDLSLFISYLLGSRSEAFLLKKGGLCRVDLSFGKTRSKAELVWYLTPKLLSMLATRPGK